MQIFIWLELLTYMNESLIIEFVRIYTVNRMERNPFAPAFTDLPETIAIFPLAGVLLLPCGRLPLNIFEPRYLAMVKHVMGGERLIGMVQPKPDGTLYDVGGLGRITRFTDPEDGRLLIVLTGVTRFRTARELDVATPFRQVEADYSAFAGDFRSPDALAPVLRAELEKTAAAHK